MDRRAFNKLTGLAAISALCNSADSAALPRVSPAIISPKQVILEDNLLRVEFDSDSGALTRLERKTTSWTIQRRPELGVSFRLLAPLPHRRDNQVLGHKQRASVVKKVSEEQILLQWKSLVSEHGGALAMTFSALVTLRNGGLTFEGTLLNESPLHVETIDYPYLGDLTPPSRNDRMSSEHMWYGNLESEELYPTFRNGKGYWGVKYPTKTVESKQTLFCLIQSRNEGLYVEMHDPTQPYLLEYTFEQHPGVLQSIDETVPLTEEIFGIPVHLEFRTCHFVFAAPGSTRKLVPVVLRTYSGDWHAGVDLYKQWRQTWFQTPHIANWVQEVNAWQQLQINAPEEDYTIPYRNIGGYVDECARQGIAAIQLVGWNKGGQDRGDPSQDIDPELGTWQELHDQILQAQAKGVKIILFAKLNWADMTTEWFKSDLYKYAATDPYGNPYETDGYSYFTPTQLAGINNRRRQVMDFLSPAYRDIAEAEFSKIIKLGAAGWLFDESCHHGPVEYSFSPDHGYTPPGYIYAGDIPMVKQLRVAADKTNPDFIFAGEGSQDWLTQHYPVSYFRIQADSRAVSRYIDPHAPLIVAVTGFDDREMLNLILLNRYIISYEPYNFKGRITDFPSTLAYGQKIDSLRRRYREWLWDAEFQDTLGAAVTSDGRHAYSVFLTSSGKRAVVVVNQEQDKSISTEIKLPHTSSFLSATPEQPEAHPTSGRLQIPARSAVVVMQR